jgi:hypothetical protein
MKKILKWLAIFIGASIFLLIVVSLGLKFSGLDPAADFKGKSLRAQGKIFATSVSSALQIDYVDTGKYSVSSLEQYQSEVKNLKSTYSIGTRDSDPRIANLCPDCEIREKTFKIALYGNIDEDEALDIMTIDQGNNIILIQDDLNPGAEPQKL